MIFVFKICTLNSRYVMVSILSFVIIMLLASPIVVFAQSSPNKPVELTPTNSSCPSGKICVATFSSVNEACLTGTTVTVTVNNTGTDTVLTVSASPPTGKTIYGIGDFGYNSATTTSSANTGTWQLNKDTGFSHDYGTFLGNDHGNNGVVGSSVQFTLSGLVTSWTPNDNGNLFLAHIKLAGGCTGWVSGVPSFIVTPEFPVGSLLAILTPLAAFGLYFGARRGFKLF